MARKRFNAGERAVINAAGAGGRIQWQNLTQWHAGRIADPVIITDDGWQYVAGVNLDSTARLSAGPIRITPGHIRPA